MANQQHLAILKQGVEVWNQWRKEHPEIRPDLSEADWVETDLIWPNSRSAFSNGAVCRVARAAWVSCAHA
jgi:hypothetical protein